MANKYLEMLKNEASTASAAGAVKVGAWRCSVETFTPQKADEWLQKRNTRNRAVRKSHVTFLAGVMRRGEFALTPECMMVSPGGRLLNGQHRLYAVIESGATVQFLVFWDVEEALYEKIDQGTRRRFDDLFQTERRMQEAITAISRLHRGNSIAPDQVRPYLYRFGPAVNELIAACGKTAKGRSSAPIKAGIAIAMAKFPEKWSEIACLYRSFVLLEFDSLPPSVLGLIRQVDNGNANVSRTNETIARAFRAFDPSKWGLSKIQINDGHVSDIKAVLDDLMG